MMGLEWFCSQDSPFKTMLQELEIVEEMVGEGDNKDSAVSTACGGRAEFGCFLCNGLAWAAFDV